MIFKKKSVGADGVEFVWFLERDGVCSVKGLKRARARARTQTHGVRERHRKREREKKWTLTAPDMFLNNISISATVCLETILLNYVLSPTKEHPVPV